MGGIGGRGAAVVIVLVLITATQVVLGELLPKTVALRYPEKLAMAVLVPMQISQWVFRPLVVLFNGSAFGLMKMWNLQVDHSHAHVHSPEELAGLYRASAAGGLIDASERDHAITIHSPEVTTIAAVVLAATSILPSPGTTVTVQGHNLTVEDMRGRKITRVRVRPLGQAPLAER